MSDENESVASRLWRDRAQIREQERNEAQARLRIAEEKVAILTAENDRACSRSARLRALLNPTAIPIALRDGTTDGRNSGRANASACSADWDHELIRLAARQSTPPACNNLSPSLLRSLGNIAPGQTNVGKLPIRQGCQLASRLTGTTPLAKAGKNDRKKHDATSIMSQPKRKGAANWQREKGPPVGVAEFREETRHREAVAEEGSSTAHPAQDKPESGQPLPCGMSMERMWSVYTPLRFARGCSAKPEL